MVEFLEEFLLILRQGDEITILALPLDCLIDSHDSHDNIALAGDTSRVAIKRQLVLPSGPGRYPSESGDRVISQIVVFHLNLIITAGHKVHRGHVGTDRMPSPSINNELPIQIETASVVRGHRKRVLA